MISKSPERLVVIGASAGGVGALQTLLSQLPSTFPAAVAITLHRSPTLPSFLPQVLNRTTATLLAIEPRDGQAVEPGVAFVAPPDRHLMIRNHRIYLERTAKQHFSRPAIDPMFISAAEDFGDAVIGVVLTGNLSDGVAGLLAIKSRGGICLAQDPEDASYPSMPLNALRFDHVDYTFRMRDLATLLTRLVAGVEPAIAHPPLTA